MSLFSYIAFPREAKLGSLSVGGNPGSATSTLEFLAAFRGLRVFDNAEAALSGIFTNPFVYCLEATFELLDAERYLADCRQSYHAGDGDDMSLDELMEFAQGLIENNKADVALCREQLRELILANTLPGEAVEMYSETIPGLITEHRFGPVRQWVPLPLTQLATSPLLRLDDGVKLEITRPEAL